MEISTLSRQIFYYHTDKARGKEGKSVPTQKPNPKSTAQHKLGEGKEIGEWERAPRKSFEIPRIAAEYIHSLKNCDILGTLPPVT
tara:strand:+ start:1514 stop:1768 length:255 start_codon:yes stop_codon:yes gene_type:complete